MNAQLKWVNISTDVRQEGRRPPGISVRGWLMAVPAFLQCPQEGERRWEPHSQAKA